jgi:hypothetical protein
MHVGCLIVKILLEVLILILFVSKKKKIDFLTVLFPSDFFVANFHQFVEGIETITHSQ